MLDIFIFPGILFVIGLIAFAINYGEDDPFSVEWFKKLFKTIRDELNEEYIPRNTKPRTIHKNAPQPPSNTPVVHLWKGSYHDYLGSKQWRRTRANVLLRDMLKCQQCGSHESLQVHHKTYNNVYFEGENNYADLTTLCQDCHSKIDHEPILKTWPGGSTDEYYHGSTK